MRRTHPARATAEACGGCMLVSPTGYVNGDPVSLVYPMETSPNYAMEHNIVRGYENYVPHILDGEPDWSAASGY